MKNSKLLLSLIFIIAVVSFTSANAQSNKKLVVLVKYKTQPGKDSIALIELKNLVAKVKKEPNYVTIIIHVDPSDKSNILLYEQWSDEEYYKGEHMKTAHLQQFMTAARSFLAGPPEITFWKIDN
jgi:quinol monooxygenase YgiN